MNMNMNITTKRSAHHLGQMQPEVTEWLLITLVIRAHTLLLVYLCC